MKQGKAEIKSRHFTKLLIKQQKENRYSPRKRMTPIVRVCPIRALVDVLPRAPGYFSACELRRHYVENK
ncbi:MAG: hypothetical protein RQ714_03685 [Nitrosomonas sp.]|nr:hypothetical protein [Nitrosomonas sp.]